MIKWKQDAVTSTMPSQFPANIYLFQVNNGNTRKRREIYSTLTIKTSFSSISIVDFEQVNVTWVSFLKNAYTYPLYFRK